ncbi:hypothetical protein TCAL_01120 [Tigriopus californicus]|uniref:Myosin motor domain-containing protein n=1 Tax=Tigriopus californicus TaxID=6832 RepID=A0A553P2X3_TIGCA|nr:unconventional myosin-X-like isoform X2 [Tigriopus californicus]TRY72029.1 hypothetical protein TCAL_01120 [Tigriopus californicus]|eukprot:TCALIF_01120-PA protein Name:"Similar to myoI Myosin-I heavy chain (Dictyostelium discoideum)" AED:0.06 eAED:0.06 QI:245/1/0.95/1/0.85/0.86/22/392/2268
MVLTRQTSASLGSKPEHGVPDMTVISDIDEFGINKNLQIRYQRDEIYTYTGSILVAVNPYKELCIYDSEYVFRYHGQKLGALPPHVFALAESAYKSLQNESINQSLVISGESGAGKTESTKFILEYLCSVTANISTWVQQQILEANTILEAFGNAKTIRNDNSSRFGRFMQVCFDPKYKIRGCVIQDYLLEQSRITTQAGHERNYHIFYQLIAAAQRDKELAQKYFLKSPSEYAYLNQSGCTTLEGVDDAVKFDGLRLAFEVVQIPAPVIDDIFSAVSAILWLGNLEFQDSEDETAALSLKDKDYIETIANLLGLESQDLTQVVLCRQINIRGNVTEIPLKYNEAKENRHAMAKALYSRTFAWLVNHINKCTNPGKDMTQFIGILDIFGFENFQTNSFEQLCINYTNEKLHKFFNHYVFAIEQETYRQEEIKFSHITFTDNTRCLELIEKPPRCVLKLLAEQCHMPGGCDAAYLTNIHAEFDSHRDYVKGDDRRNWDKEFGIKHYAGKVTYTVVGFVDKNRDTQQDVFFDFLEKSSKTFIQEICEYKDLMSKVVQLGSNINKGDGSLSKGTVKRTMTNKAKPTVSDSFRLQLQVLVDVLESTNPWYVRCIKPNMIKGPNNFNEALVLDQLKYLGMLEIIRIRKQGFPIHYSFEDFVFKYKCLMGRKLTLKDATSALKAIMDTQGLPKTEWQIGKTKVFLRTAAHEPLEDRRICLINQSSVVIQKRFKGFKERRKYIEIRQATLKIQESFLAWRSRIIFLKKRRAALVIQSHLRGMFAREVAAALREAKRVEEERRRKEKLEEERRKREGERLLQEAQDSTDDEEKMLDRKMSFACLADMNQSDADKEMKKLSQLADQLNPKLCDGINPDNVDLDQLFNFLSGEVPDSLRSESVVSESITTGSVETGDKTSILDEIDRQMSDLQNEFDQFSIKDDEHAIPSPLPPPLMDDDDDDDPPPPPREHSPPPLPPPMISGTPPTNSMTMGKPSLPEPEGPPPPPPIQNGYAFNTPHLSQEVRNPLKAKLKKPKEPIYESIKPRPEPLGAPAPSIQEHVPVKHSDYQTSFLPNHLASKSQGAPKMYHTGLMATQHSQQPIAPQSPRKGTNLDPEREARKLQRVQRGLEKIQEQNIQAEVEKENLDEEFELLEFAENFFNDHEKSPQGTIVGTLKRSKTMEFLKKTDMIKYYKGTSIPNSHIHMFDPENVSIACTIFKDLCKYSRGDYKNDTDVNLIQTIIKNGIEREELRDEIYVQCVRQLNNNPNQEQIDRLWLLLCLVVVAFPPSKSFFKYFVSFLKKNIDVEDPIHQYVEWCLDNCKHVQVATRKNPPSTVEITAMKRLGTIVCRFFFLDGRTKALDVHPCDTAMEVLQKIADKIGLLNLDGWALYQSLPEGEEHIPQHQFLYDIISQWEMNSQQNPKPSQNVKSSPMHNAKTQTLKRRQLGGTENRFIFKKRLFCNTREIPSDPIEVSLLYAQAVHTVVKGDELPVSEKVALQLAGLQAQVALGEPQNGRLELYTDVDLFLPQRIKQARFLSDREWIPILSEAHLHYGAGKSEVVAKVWYLSCVMQYPLYGCTMFNANYKGYWSYGSSIVLGINCASFLIIKPDDKAVLFEFPFADIESLLLDPSDNFVTLNLVKTVEERQRVHVFETTFKAEIGSLVASYCPALANWVREADVPRRRIKQVTNEDRMRLHQNLVQCRRALVDSDLLKKPTDETGNFFKSTLRRLSVKKMEKYRAEALANEQGEIYKGYSHVYWAFTKGGMTQTLAKMVEQDETQALEVFQLILTYAGLLQPNKDDPPCNREEEDHVLLIQTVLDKAMKKDCLVNELFLQLIKQTTDHPEPNSRVNLRHWSLVALACSVILPVDKIVRKYLLAHLKKCSADFVTEEGKYARFAEKCFHKTLGTRRRQWPPSKQEILCTINRRPIYARFHFMDGQFHAIEFDPSATADEVLKLVKAKIGLRDHAMGYAIYEVLGTQERSLLPDEKVADVMSKWEKYRSAGGTLSKQSRHHMFLFKKHLFLDTYIDLADSVEKELLYYQVLCDLRSDRFPVTDMEAVMLCALRAQIELGNYDSGEGDYRQVISHCLPPRILVNVQSDHVAMHHQSLIGMNIEEAKQAFLNLIQCWPLHKATLFDVNQSFTSNWPKTLWLAVDQRGVHLLEFRTRNVLTSFEYDSILDYTPSLNHLLLITGSDKKQSKIIVNTNQAFQISNLIREYIEVVPHNGEGVSPGELMPPNNNVSHQTTLPMQSQPHSSQAMMHHSNQFFGRNDISTVG